MDNVELKKGDTFILDDDLENEGTQYRCGFQHIPVLNDLQLNDDLLINDGLLKLRVCQTSKHHVVTKVERGGKLSSYKGVNIPYLKSKVSSLSEEDLQNIQFVNTLDCIDWVALSFVRSEQDVSKLRDLLLDRGDHMSKSKVPKIMAKIETLDALENLDKIIEISDAIMIARGDLGIEVGIEKLPAIQRDILKKCTLHNKHVVVATQMFESMIENQIPTRAEVNDVAHAIWDGATGVMLSGETSVGKYPVETANMMRVVINETTLEK